MKLGAAADPCSCDGLEAVPAGWLNLASKGPPVSLPATCLGPAVLLRCQGVRQEQGTAVIATLWKPSVAEGSALAAKQAGGSQGTNFR